MLISNCYIKSKTGNSGQAVIIDNGGVAQGCRIRRVRFDNCTFDIGTSQLNSAQCVVSKSEGIEFNNCHFSGTRETFLTLNSCMDSGARGSRFQQTLEETVIVGDLTVNSIAWISGNTAVVSFSGSPDLSGVTTANKLFISGTSVANAIVQNGGFTIQSIDNAAKTITYTNLKITDGSRNEGAGAIARVTTVRLTAAVRVISGERCFVEGGRIEAFKGYAFVQTNAVTGEDVNPFSGVSLTRNLVVRDMDVVDCHLTSAFVDSGSSIESRIENNHLHNCTGTALFAEGPGSINNVYLGNHDHGRMCAIVGSLQGASATNNRFKHSGNIGYGGDDISGRVTIPAGQLSTTLPLSRVRFVMSADGSTIDPQWVKPNASLPIRVSRSGATLTFSTATAPATATDVEYRIRA